MFEPNVCGQEPLFDVPAPAGDRRVDVDDTSRCPTRPACDVCGQILRELSVVTAACQVGVFCLTVCETCLQAGTVPAMSPISAFEYVVAHCEHLGIDLDQMAAATGRDGEG